MKNYIFVAGAPGSKWSSVVKNIYYSPDIDRSDYRDEWTYYHDAPGTLELMHLGAYFDPGMECDIPEDLSPYSREQLEEMFDRPFAQDNNGIRIIKSHIFCNNISHLKRTFPECSIVLVYRSDDACLGWWVKCGHFNITYPRYDQYYIDLRHMAKIIRRQNQDLLKAFDRLGVSVHTNHQLADILRIGYPPAEYTQTYHTGDIRVKVI